ncbi:MAG: putative Na+/H+ antiporter [Myxococcota bacterium]|nr:putative Na+/H+ antiporter [Myxococcota bacterium]
MGATRPHEDVIESVAVEVAARHADSGQVRPVFTDEGIGGIGQGGRIDGQAGRNLVAFVFAIMAMAATRPVLQLSTTIIDAIARILPLSNSVSFFMVALIMGPLLGSFITEPAAMTVTALILKERYYDRGMSQRLMYATIGVLFVNVSIGGTLTHFAAPPVLMVAGKWDWGTMHMILNFGWKSAVAVVINAAVLTWMFRTELREADTREDYVEEKGEARAPAPWWLIVLHMIFMGLVVLNAHHMIVFLGIFLFFLGVVAVTDEHQSPLQLKEALLVGFFLGGLVTLGALQRWWLQPLLGSITDLPLFIGATGLTAITDNAALTFLGSQVPSCGGVAEGVACITETAKFALVAGAVAGGGLTVIANAPNPAGYGILKNSFPDNAISPLGLLLAALPPTSVAMACLWFLPSL